MSKNVVDASLKLRATAALKTEIEKELDVPDPEDEEGVALLDEHTEESQRKRSS